MFESNDWTIGFCKIDLGVVNFVKLILIESDNVLFQTFKSDFHLFMSRFELL